MYSNIDIITRLTKHFIYYFWLCTSSSPQHIPSTIPSCLCLFPCVYTDKNITWHTLMSSRYLLNVFIVILSYFYNLSTEKICLFPFRTCCSIICSDLHPLFVSKISKNTLMCGYKCFLIQCSSSVSNACPTLLGHTIHLLGAYIRICFIFSGFQSDEMHYC